LRDVFAAPLPDVTEEHIEDVVRRQVREDSDLDFKETLYGTSDRDKHALAGDVGALANSRGGMIVLGVRENDAAAAATTPVDLSDGEEQRVRQITATKLTPYVPYEILRIPTQADPARGFYLLVVPPSINRPHAVRVDDRTLRYPRRDGTTTRWLASPRLQICTGRDSGSSKTKSAGSVNSRTRVPPAWRRPPTR
jgi:predicted HTH transcriptional regulator